MAQRTAQPHSQQSPQPQRHTHKNNNLPKSMTEKNDFKQNYLQALAKDYDKELNFQEAVANAYLAYTERELILPDDLDDDDDGDAIGTTTTTTKLTILYRALKQFMQEHDGRPPLQGSIPDMTASTEWYVQLQTIYKQQADHDLERMIQLVKTHQNSNNNDNNRNGSSSLFVTEDDVANFCANVYMVGHMKTRPLTAEYRCGGIGTATKSSTTTTTTTTDEQLQELVDDWKMALMDPYEVPIHTPLLWYLGVRACQTFCAEHGRYPGVVVLSTEGNSKQNATSTSIATATKQGSSSNNNDNNTEDKDTEYNVDADDDDAWKKDIDILVNIFQQQVIPQYQLTDHTSDADGGLLSTENVSKLCHELTRYGNAEIHTVASVVGGVASQEAVKIITGQYIPLDNTYVYNGIVSVGGVYKF
jgi:amyloid beta precursor protein binding protein 1